MGFGIKVPNCVLDEYCLKQKISKVDFAKIDLEGYELKALMGWKRELSSHAVRSILIEIIPENQSRYGLESNAPLLFLEALGYDLFLFKSNMIGIAIRRIKFISGIAVPVVQLNFKIDGFCENDTPLK